MKESITKFDLEAAFKALDEIEIPQAEKGIKANKPALTEIFSAKSKLDLLLEDYYDISNGDALTDAKEAREAEVAKAKLARIEKIVDLDAESPEDLLTSYVGKFIIQCPQCMTLFYKSPEDIEKSEDDENTVNVNEVCQHCGNDSGYTLIGKVGEVEEPLPEEPSAETDELATTEEEATDNEEATDVENESEEDLNLDDDFAELDLELEDESENSTEDKKEESLLVDNNTTLLENLNEEDTLDVSSSEFEKLINSTEFKQSISDREVRNMMQEFEESKSVSEELITEENILDKIKNKVTNIKKNKAPQTREQKADWLLQNALTDYHKAKIDNIGELVPEEDNRRFKVFLVMGFTNRYKNGKVITVAPSFSNKDLEPGMPDFQAKKTYKEADNIARGWSLEEGHGPAFIFLAQDKQDPKPVFLCEYFDGELELDQLDKYCETVNKSIEGAKLRAEGNDDSFIDKITAAKLEVGDTVSYLNEITGETLTATVEDIKQSKLGNGTLCLKLRRTKNGIAEFFTVVPETQFTLVQKTRENLTNIMTGIEELHESSLESLISDSLIEKYENIAGFRLQSCSYLNEQLVIEGTLIHTSGLTEKIAYQFTEGTTLNQDKVKFLGLNENLTLKSQIELIGRVENEHQVFITESFKILA